MTSTGYLESNTFLEGFKGPLKKRSGPPPSRDGPSKNLPTTRKDCQLQSDLGL